MVSSVVTSVCILVTLLAMFWFASRAFTQLLQHIYRTRMLSNEHEHTMSMLRHEHAQADAELRKLAAEQDRAIMNEMLEMGSRELRAGQEIRLAYRRGFPPKGGI